MTVQQPGIGVLIQALAGETSGEDIEAATGRAIARAWLDPDAHHDDGAFILDFEDGSRLTIVDKGRSCCEARYLTCDDDLDALQGATLHGVELREGPTIQVHGPEPHEQMFVLIVTSKRIVTLVTHNEHNGYYGGFAPAATFEEGDDA